MKLKKLLRRFNSMKKIFEIFNKILITIIFFISCSEETILYDEIENREGTIKTA